VALSVSYGSEICVIREKNRKLKGTEAAAVVQTGGQRDFWESLLVT